MKIFTYYEDIWGHPVDEETVENFHPDLHLDKIGRYRERLLLQAWEKNWKKKGFDVQVLRLKDAKKHPQFEEIMQKFATNCKKIRTNPCADTGSKELSSYGASCFHRWLAFAALDLSEEFYVSDYDVFNNSLENKENNKHKGKFVSYQWATPAFVKGNSKIFDFFIKKLLQLSSNIQFCKKRHKEEKLESVHDQDLIFMHKERLGNHPKIFLDPTESVIANYDRKKKNRPVIHLSHHAALRAFPGNPYALDTILNLRLRLIDELNLN